MAAKLVLLTGPPAVGKTTLSTIVGETLERITGHPVIYVSSELVMRIQALALGKIENCSAMTFQGSQLIVEDAYRGVLTDAAIRGLARLVDEFGGGKINIVAEIPETGLKSMVREFTTEAEYGRSDHLLIWLDAPYDRRLRRNQRRGSYLRLPHQAMAFFEENRAELESDVYSMLGPRILFVDTSPKLGVVSRLIVDGIEAAFGD